MINTALLESLQVLDPNETVVYILELEDSKYYIGKSTAKNVIGRISNHSSGSGSKWTQLHKPKKVVNILPDSNQILEKKLTLEYMKVYGWQNVRGYTWSQVKISHDPNI